MNKGTKRTTIRIPDALRAIAEDYLEERNKCPLAEWWSMTDLVNQALREALLKRGRSGQGLLAEAADDLRAVQLPTENGQHLSRGVER
jgi:hypothetical protein